MSSSSRTIKLSKGFTLIELLTVIIIIAILAVIIFVAINPAKRLQDSRNAQRTDTIQSILTAINQYISDNKGGLPASISGGAINTDYQIGNGTCSIPLVNNGCNTSTARCANLGSDLSKYLKSVPIDPLGNPTATAANTGYAVSYDANNIITVKACDIEAGLGPLPLFDSASTAQHQAPPSSPITWNHTMTSQNNSILIVTVSYDNTGFSSSGITYNGLPLTLAAAVPCPHFCITEMWYRLNPPSGTHTISLSTTATTGSIVAGSSSYYNVDQSNPTATSNNGHSKGFSQSVVSTPNQMIVDSVSSDGSNYTIGTGQTLNNSDGSNVFGSSSYQIAVGASTTMAWTSPNPNNWAQIILPLNPANAATLMVSR